MTFRHALALASMPLALALCAAAPAFAQDASPASKDSGTLARSNDDMRAVIEKLQSLGAKPIDQLSVKEARKQPTPADAVKAVLKDRGVSPATMGVAKTDTTYPAGEGKQKIRLYTPEGASGPLPVIVFYHGGGWVIADIAVYESSALALAKKANAIVASVEYRHAPEHKFPAAHDDAFAAYKWVLENAKSFKGDASKVAVAGESAGGNMAMTTAIKARNEGVQAPIHILAVYPVAGTDLATPSYQENENAIPLSKAGIEWFVDKALATPEDKESPLLNLYAKADLKGLPPVTIVNADIDPLLSDGELLEAALKKAGVDVAREVKTGVTHEFFGMDAVLADAKAAQDFAVQRLSAAFSGSAATGATKQAE